MPMVFTFILWTWIYLDYPNANWKYLRPFQVFQVVALLLRNVFIVRLLSCRGFLISSTPWALRFEVLTPLKCVLGTWLHLIPSSSALLWPQDVLTGCRIFSQIIQNLVSTISLIVNLWFKIREELMRWLVEEFFFTFFVICQLLQKVLQLVWFVLP